MQGINIYHWSPEIWNYSYKNLPDGYEVISWQATGGSKKKFVTVGGYNSHGHLVREKTGARITVIKYDYDENGEWIRKKTFLREGALMPWVCKGEWRRVRRK